MSLVSWADRAIGQVITLRKYDAGYLYFSGFTLCCVVKALAYKKQHSSLTIKTYLLHTKNKKVAVMFQ